jgi:hypothetical protein
MNKHTQTEMSWEDIIKHPEYIEYVSKVDEYLEKNLKWHYDGIQNIHLLSDGDYVVGVVAQTEFGYITESASRLKLPTNIKEWLHGRQDHVYTSCEAAKDWAMSKMVRAISIRFDPSDEYIHGYRNCPWAEVYRYQKRI